MSDNDEPDIVHSTLRRRIERDGTHLDVEIYRGADERDWILEVVDEEGASTVYHDRFATDRAALEEVLRTIEKHGIRTFLEGRAGGDQ